MIVCAIDIGTNSVRTLVADIFCAGSVVALHRDGIITRLGQDLDRTGLLKPEAMQRTIEALEKFVAKAEQYKAEAFKIVATSAARDASNAEKFLDEIKRCTGKDAKIVTGAEEAEYIYKGVSCGLEIGDKAALIIDIGGGSTEFIFHAEQRPIRTFSADIGAVRLTEMFISNDPPKSHELETLTDFTIPTIQSIVDQLNNILGCELLGVGGTITTIPAIIMNMGKYDGDRIHNYILSKEEIEKVFQRLAKLNLDERKEVKGLEPKRADIIIAGILILKAILDVTRSNSIRVSDRGILYGLALSAVGK